MAKESKSSVDLGFEQKLWEAADLLRSNMDPAEYKHVVLGLIFLKYISDAFEAQRGKLQTLVKEPKSEYYVEGSKERVHELEALLEDRDEYVADNVFWVPREARWEGIQANAKQPTIGKVVDDAMEAIEHENTTLKGVLPKIYGLPGLDKQGLGKLIDLIGGIGLGSAEHQARDTLGAVYEYFLSRFASAEGKGGGEFFTPSSVVRLLVEMIEPFEGRVYDPCCGSGGMFVQSVKFVEAHNGQRDQVSIYGQESNRTTWRMARMNLAIRGLEAHLGSKHADSFREDLHADLRADFVFANPPFNVSEWHGEQLRDDVRWKYGVPPTGNANFAWVQHFVHHLAPSGIAGFVLANGSTSSMQSGEGEIRQELVEADLVDCVVALPGQLFYATPIPVCLWFVKKDRLRAGQTLFIDARKLGRMETRVHRVFDRGDLERVAGAYHRWRDQDGYEDEAGFCKAASMEEIGQHDFVLTPGWYSGIGDEDDDGELLEEKLLRLTSCLSTQTAESRRLDKEIEDALQRLDLGP